MELIDTHITFTWEEFREAILEGTIERMVSNIGVLLNDGYDVSVHAGKTGDIKFSNINELKAYIKTIPLNREVGAKIPPPKA